MTKKPEASLPFHFTPVDEPGEGENPHAKATTEVSSTVEQLRDAFGDDILDVAVYAGEYSVLVSSSKIVEICQYMKSSLGFNYLADLAGCDRATDKDRFEIFYNLVNLDQGKRIRLRIRIDEGTLTAPSVTSVYRAANWNERECFDMLGIRFEGHHDLRRMFMPEDFEYHPLRKEFPLLGIPGSLPLPPQTPEGGLTWDPFAAAHGSKPVKSFDESVSPSEGEKK